MKNRDFCKSNCFIGRSLAAIALAILIATPNICRSQERTEEKLNETLGSEYREQYRELDRYLAVSVGTESDQNGKEENTKKFEMIYAFDRVSDLEKSPIERFENFGTWISSNGSRRTVRERTLRESGHEWLEGNGMLIDLLEKSDLHTRKIRYTSPKIVDPFALPLAYSNALLVGCLNRDIAELMMPPGRMLRSFDDGNGVSRGVWLHGKEQDLGVTEIKFHERFGNMPIELNLRVARPNETIVKRDYLASTVPYVTNKIEWKIHSNKWLPYLIESEEHGVDPSSFSINIQWWIGDEVPAEVFEFDDFKRGSASKSVIQDLIHEKDMDQLSR